MNVCIVLGLEKKLAEDVIFFYFLFFKGRPRHCFDQDEAGSWPRHICSSSRLSKNKCEN